MGKKYVDFRVNLEEVNNKPAEWYTLITMWNYEQKVSNDITRLMSTGMKDIIQEVVTPIKQVRTTVERKAGPKIVVKNEKVMPNYVFIKTKLNAQIWQTLLNITGVQAILCTSGIPVNISEKEIDNIKKICGINTEDTNNLSQEDIDKLLNKDFHEGMAANQ